MSESVEPEAKSRHWSGPGRKAEVEEPKRRNMYLGLSHWKKLKALAKKWKLRGPSAAIRTMLDDYDYD